MILDFVSIVAAQAKHLSFLWAANYNTSLSGFDDTTLSWSASTAAGGEHTSASLINRFEALETLDGHLSTYPPGRAAQNTIHGDELCSLLRGPKINKPLAKIPEQVRGSSPATEPPPYVTEVLDSLQMSHGQYFAPRASDAEESSSSSAVTDLPPSVANAAEVWWVPCGHTPASLHSTASSGLSRLPALSSVCPSPCPPACLQPPPLHHIHQWCFLLAPLWSSMLTFMAAECSAILAPL